MKKKIKKILKVLLFVLLISLALVGIGLPVPLFPDHMMGPENKWGQLDRKRRDDKLKKD